MLASVISALGLLATSVFATPVVLLDERAASTFRISTFKVVQSNKNLNQQTQVTFSFTIQDLTAGPVNYCHYVYDPIPEPFPSFLTNHPCKNVGTVGSTTGPTDIHWTFRIDSYNGYDDFSLSLKHDPGADPQGAAFDAGIDSSANGVLAQDRRVASYVETAPPANGQLTCAPQGNGFACNAPKVFTVAARQQ
ncbi:MAG: hypothetical protein Q9227_004439 [Pyrenula ochraceoflavens]